MMNHASHKPPHTSPTLLSGALGLVIVPDHATIERAYALAEEIMPKDAQYVLRPGSLPHLTLYHGKFADIPKQVACDMIGTRYFEHLV